MSISPDVHDHQHQQLNRYHPDPQNSPSCVQPSTDYRASKSFDRIMDQPVCATTLYLRIHYVVNAEEIGVEPPPSAGVDCAAASLLGSARLSLDRLGRSRSPAQRRREPFERPAAPSQRLMVHPGRPAEPDRRGVRLFCRPPRNDTESAGYSRSERSARANSGIRHISLCREGLTAALCSSWPRETADLTSSSLYETTGHFRISCTASTKVSPPCVCVCVWEEGEGRREGGGEGVSTL